MVYQDRNGETLGAALREWRELCGLTFGAVSQTTDTPITRLVDIENDKIGPSGELLMKLAELYSQDCEGYLDEAGWSAVLTWMRLFARLESPTNRQMLDIVGASIRRMRNLPDGALVHMRDQEADIISSVLDLTDESLADDIVGALGYEPELAVDFVDRAIARMARRESLRQPILGRIGTGSGTDSVHGAA